MAGKWTLGCLLEDEDLKGATIWKVSRLTVAQLPL
jgi:hypothetical protein